DSYHHCYRFGLCDAECRGCQRTQSRTEFSACHKRIQVTIVTAWVFHVDWICLAIEVFMKTQWIFLITVVTIPGPKSASIRVEVSSAVVVQSQVRVILLAAIKVKRLRRPVGGDDRPVSVIRKGVDKIPPRIRQHPRRA